MAALIDDIVADPSVAGVLAHPNPIVAPAPLIGAVLQVDALESITQTQIDSAGQIPEIQRALAAMTGTDTDGTPISIANIRLIDTGDERVRDAEHRINEMAAGDDGPLRVSSLSPVVVEDEYKQATEQGMGPLIGIALLLIAALLLLFTRTLSDMLLTLTGLVFSIVWVVGAEGWLGPNALGLIGPPSSLTAMVPVIIISLTVDYAIQTVSHYREQRVEGEPVVRAVREGLRKCHCPAHAGCRYDDRQPVGDTVLADRGDWRLRRRRGTGRWDELDSDADAYSCRSYYHRPKTRVTRNPAAHPPDLECIARHPAGSRAAREMGYASTGALHSRSDHRNDRPRVRRHRAEIRIQHQRHPAKRWERAGGYEHPRISRRWLDGDWQPPYQG